MFVFLVALQPIRAAVRSDASGLIGQEFRWINNLGFQVDFMLGMLAVLDF
jgi:hypothetical protein